MSFLLLGYIACQTNADKSQSLLSAYSKVQQYTWAKFSFYVWGAKPSPPLRLRLRSRSPRFHLLLPPWPFPPVLFTLPFVRSRPPYIQLGGMGEHCKLPQRGLGWSPSRNQIWCILALKYDIWWQQRFSWESTYQILCSLSSIKANRDHAFFCSKQDFSK